MQLSWSVRVQHAEQIKSYRFSKVADRTNFLLNTEQTPYLIQRGTRWRSWVRHCATSRKVAGLIPDGVTEILH